MRETFTVTARDGAARAGVLRTAHGEVRTPAFMPVGTKATVKAVDPGELRTIGAEIVLGNAYHLHFRPGEELIAGAKGIAEGGPASLAGKTVNKFRPGGLMIVRAGGNAGMFSGIIGGWSAGGPRGSIPVTKEVRP